MDRFDFLLSLLDPGNNNWATRNIDTNEPINITLVDVSTLLKAYLSKQISQEQLTDWANLVLFNDSFEFDGDVLCECLNRIEESDEPGCELTDEIIVQLLKELK